MGKFKEYKEMTLEEARKRCNKNAMVLVAVDDLADDSTNSAFERRTRNEYDSLFEDAKTISSICDEWIKEMKVYTEKQDLKNIKPHGIQRTILMRVE